MDEKDKEIQELRRKLKAVTEENDALMGELNELQECSTCVHRAERNTHCRDGKHIGVWCPEKDGYKWRGIDAYYEWLQEQETLRRLEQQSAEEEAKFEREYGEWRS